MSKGTPRHHTESGIRCPKCDGSFSAVTDSRPNDTFAIHAIRRRRECACGHRYTTYESLNAPETIRQMEKKLREEFTAHLAKVLLP